MRRIFRAFIWMRWRILINALERTGARDALERFSVATEKLGPILAVVLLVPSAIALFALGMAAGFGVATGEWTIPMEVVRYFLILATVLTIVGPIMLPTRDSGSIIRLLLLPIPRLGLYIGQTAGAIADPWIVLNVPLVLGVVIGLAAGLKFVAAVITLLAGAAFVLFLIGVTALISSVVQLLLRDRRRGEIVMFILVVLIPMAGMMPQMMLRSERREGRRLTREERAALPPSRTERIATSLLPYVPSEMYRRAALRSVTTPLRSAAPIALLSALALAIHAGAFAVYRRLLEMPASSSARRAGAFGGLWTRVLPGLTPSASAVAFTQLRLGLRTPRGRASIVTPLLLPVFFGFIMTRAGRSPVPGLESSPGLGLAAFGVFASILALLPLAMNQFAIDKAGFTRQMLAPLSVRELLIGKAVGNGLIAAIPAVTCLLLTALVFPGGPTGYWIGLALAAVATYTLLSPAAATLSALFPKTVDLNSIGNGSNAHQAAGLLGMVCVALSIAPCALIALAASGFLHRPDLVPTLLLGWCLVTLALSYALFFPVARFVESRCENLAQHY